MTRAGALATVRRRHVCGDRTESLGALGLLVDVVASRVLQLGTALGEPDSLPVAAGWSS